MLAKITYTLVLLALGFVAGSVDMALKRPPPEFKYVSGIRPAVQLIRCEDPIDSVQEVSRICRARARMEKVGGK
jgi:hypothetical protein